MKEARTPAQLARGPQGEVLQVGAYKTETFENITDISTSVEANRVVRIQSYGGDNWIKRSNTGLSPATLNTANMAGAKIVFDGSGESTLNGTELIWQSDRVWTEAAGGADWGLGWDGGNWYLVNALGEAYLDPTSAGTALPTNLLPDNGGVVGTGPALAPAPTTTEMGTVIEPAVDGEGMLLPEGAEITMLLYAEDVIATIGGTLNIVQVNSF